ncbi:MAG: N-acetylmuramoyl-L-alanine amidase [Candidatus Eremiobacteraeota bacterium]|nr:N-acetylmuramoyl-L-alanine amidase [Candidatus Eremiobacteraeota bacterium]
MVSSSENRIDSYPNELLESWRPELPKGRIERIYTHWSAHDYEKVFPAYHFCVATRADGKIVVVNTHDVRENMRNVYDAPDEPYAAHTRGRNSFALGISIMAMEGAKPDDFGVYPLTEPLIDALCKVGAYLASYYSVPVDADHIMSHAEAALHDGYFGTAENERWDIARLRAESRALVQQDAIDVGEELRRRMRTF